jgi:DNA-3-methyladenine glycosylase II
MSDGASGRHKHLRPDGSRAAEARPAARDPGRSAWLRQARSTLRQADPVMARLIDERPAFDPRAWLAQLPSMDLYGALLFQITGQQLSVAATRRILSRIEQLFGDRLPAPWSCWL